MKRFFGKAFAVMRSEYLRWLTQPRMLSVGVLLVFMYQIVIARLQTRADRLGQPLNVLEPFIAAGNSGRLVMLMPLVFLILFSDYPRLSPNSMLLMHRTGRAAWLTGQLMFAVSAILTYLCAILLGAVLCCPRGICTANWSDAVTKYSAAFPAEIGSFDSMLLPSQLYNQISLARAFRLTLIWLFCYLLLLVLILYLCRLLRAQTLGLAAVMLVIAGGVLTCALRPSWMWAFPMAHTIPWLHYDEILREPVVPISVTAVFWAVSLGLGTAGCFAAARRLEFL